MKVNKEAVFKELERRREERQRLDEAVKKARKARLDESNKAVPKRAANPRVVNETRKVNRGPQTINEAIALRTKNMSGETKHMYEILSENIAKATKTIYSEVTQAGAWTHGAVGQGAGVGLVKTYFDIFFGYFPSLIVPEIASTQPIKTEKAMVFFYQTVAGSDKGGVTKGDVLISPFAVNTDPEYTSNKVSIAPGDSTVPLWGPYLAQSVTVPGIPIKWTADGVFEAVTGSEAVLKGVVTVADGAIKVVLTGTSAAGVEKVQYAYANKYAPTAVPELNANIDSREITAMARTIKTNYSFQAGFGFEAQFGAKLEDKLAEAAMYELKRETDLDFVFEIMNAADVSVRWNKAAGVPNGLYEIHKLSFIDAVAEASNTIFKRSKRAAGNVLLVGINAQTIVQTLPAFKGETYGSQLGGAKVIGKLGDHMKVIAIPELGANDWAVIYKDPKDNLDAGIIFAPYIPVVATPTVMLDDLMARKAYTTSYGKLVVNKDYFVIGEIIEEPLQPTVQVLDKQGDVIEKFGLSS